MSKFGFNPAEYRSSPSPLRLVTAETPEVIVPFESALVHALRYADLGWYVLPVRADKRPLDGYGLNSCTRDPDVIRNIWTEHPHANIAVACERSGLVVLDIDPRNGGLETLARLEAEHGVIYSAVVSRTQGGGEHRVFKAEAGENYPGTLGAGLDVKHRGYILVEPSRGESGAYAWQPGKDPTGGTLPTTAPALIKTGRFSLSTVTAQQSHNVIRPGSVVVAPEAYADLERALAQIAPDSEYGTWFKVLQGLSRLSDRDRTYHLARDWSMRSGKPGHTEAAFKDKWRACMREDYQVGYTSIFFMADSINREWRNTPVEQVSKHPLSLMNSLRSGAGRVTTQEYVFDRFMSTGVNIVAGAPGVGKTTLIVPLALAVAHLCPSNNPLKPRVRRNVIIITESVVQVQRVIYSLATWGCTGMNDSDFDERVKVISALRLEPKLVSEVAAEYKTWTHPNAKVDGSVFEALPLVVFDTANSVLELESENDNSEVGRAMAFMKQAFAEFPVIIVAHTSKVLGRGETDGLSTRGASAWTGDAQGTYMVFKDGEGHDAPRVFKTDKVRFPTAFDEMTFELVTNQEQHPNVLGELEDEWFTHSVARPLARGERGQLKEERKEQKEQDEWVALCDELLELIRQQPEHSRSYYERLSKAQGGPGHSQERKERAITSLIGDGCVKIVMLDKPKGRADHYLRVDEEVVSAVNKGRYSV